MKQVMQQIHTFFFFYAYAGSMWLLSGSIPHTRSKEAENEMHYTYLLHHSYDGIISPPKTNYSLYRQKGKQCVLSGNPLSGTRNHQKPTVERKKYKKAS